MTTTTQSKEKAVPPVVLPADLRDYFAAKAMQGLLARKFTQDERGRPFVEWVAEFSFEIADAMPKARDA